MLLVPAHSASANLRAGAAKVDITPPPGVEMWGYARRASGARGTRDPLHARVLVLDSGTKRMALVTVDLGRPFGPASLEKLRAAALSHGVSYVLLAATHTHSGPVIQDAYPKGAPAWEGAALEKIAAAISDAAGHLVDATLGTGKGVTYIGHNRLRQNADGSISWFERNPTNIPTSPVDPTVSVLRIDGPDGVPVAVLVNYACHPVVFGPDNLEYSADFPGVTTKIIEEAFGRRTVCLFLQGAPGDINPLLAVTPLQQDALKAVDWSGRKLGKEALRVAKTISPAPAGDNALDFAEDLLEFKLRWDPERFRAAILDIFGPKAFEEFAPQIQERLRLPVGTVLLDRRIALASVPGEPFTDFQVNWRARCPVPDAFFAGYANGYYGYFPTIRAATLGGYGATSATTWVEPGAGERMVDHAVIKIYEMLGKLTNAPQTTAF